MKDINDFKSYKKSSVSALEFDIIRFAWQVSLSFIDIEPYVQIIFTPNYSTYFKKSKKENANRMQHTKYNSVPSWSRFAEAYVNKKEATFGVVFMSQCWCDDLISKCFDFTYLCP